MRVREIFGSQYQVSRLDEANKFATAMAKIKNYGPKTIISMIQSYALLDRYLELQDLSDEYNAYQNGDKTTTLFGNMSLNEANTKFNDAHNRIYGEMTLIVVTAIKTPVIFFKLLNWVLSIIGKGVGTAVGAGLGGGAGAMAGYKLGGIAASAVTSLAIGLDSIVKGGITGVLFQAFMASDYGKAFLQDSVMQFLTQGIGNLETKVVDSGIKAIEATTDTKAPSEAKPDIKPVTGTSAQTKAVPPEWSKKPMKVTYDPNNEKIMYVNRVQVTDKDGYLLPYALINDINTTSRLFNIKNPLDGIPKKPGVDYSY